MQNLTRLICAVYLAFLTALLLTANPLRFIGIRGPAPSLLKSLMPAAHLLSFGLLAVLALSTRWLAPRWAVVLILIGYAAMTEVTQGYFPPRTPKWIDWFQDVAGILLAAAMCWLAARIIAAVGGRVKGAAKTTGPSARR
jgi:hypothetical protein